MFLWDVCRPQEDLRCSKAVTKITEWPTHTEHEAWDRAVLGTGCTGAKGTCRKLDVSRNPLIYGPAPSHLPSTQLRNLTWKQSSLRPGTKGTIQAINKALRFCREPSYLLHLELSREGAGSCCCIWFMYFLFLMGKKQQFWNLFSTLRQVINLSCIAVLKLPNFRQIKVLGFHEISLEDHTMYLLHFCMRLKEIQPKHFRMEIKIVLS